MNFTYFKFLFINTIKRKPVWITWLLFLFTCTCFIIILPLAAKMNTLQIWANTTMAICQTFMGMTAALFTAVLAINIYKDTNEEGTELIVISKPITRFSIVLTKVLVFLFMCLVVNISACVITLFTIFLPRTEVQFYWGLVVSMLIGNAVTFMVFGSVAILMSVNFAKVGIIIVNIVLSLVFLIYQALTLFCFSTPGKALIDNSMATTSYITMDRDEKTGEYKEDHLVKFVANVLEEKGHPCSEVVDWKGMKEYWEKDILGQDPSLALNLTDLAGQISLTYLSVGIDDYALRQAQRAFALSRFYNYTLTSPASPELQNVENQKTIKWLYCDEREIIVPEEIAGEEFTIVLPGEVGFNAIPPGDSTRIRGFTDKIPVGYVKSKEFLSEREVLFEKDAYNKYKVPFDLMYDRIYDMNNYKDLIEESEEPQYIDYAHLFSFNNKTIQRYYNLIWKCFTGASDSLIKPEGYGEEYFDIKTVDDLNDRFIQFKYYIFSRAYAEQQNLLNGITQLDPTYEIPARKDVVAVRQNWADLLGLNLKYDENSYMVSATDEEGLIKLYEPNTKTVSFQTLIDTYYTIVAKMLEEGKTDDEIIAVTNKSGLGIMRKLRNIYFTTINPHENFLFCSLKSPLRTAQNGGEAHFTTLSWTPYIATWYLQHGGDKAKGPMGHNLQMFYFKAEPTMKYWYYTILWTIVSLGLLAAGIVVYNKYDFK